MCFVLDEVVFHIKVFALNCWLLMIRSLHVDVNVSLGPLNRHSFSLPRGLADDC